MASRSIPKTLSLRLSRQVRPVVQRRTFVGLTGTSRSAVARPAVAGGYGYVQSRGVKTVDFAGHKEQVYERADWPREKLLVIALFFSPFKAARIEMELILE